MPSHESVLNVIETLQTSYNVIWNIGLFTWVDPSNTQMFIGLLEHIYGQVIIAMVIQIAMRLSDPNSLSHRKHTNQVRMPLMKNRLRVIVILIAGPKKRQIMPWTDGPVTYYWAPSLRSRPLMSATLHLSCSKRARQSQQP